jgi:tRNA dimethylallyltransferase
LRYNDRELLYERINRRADIMLETGLISEAENLLEYKNNIKRIGAIGYTELFDYFDGVCGLEEAAEKIKRNTRRYAKRQITWFKRDACTRWIDAGEQNLNKNIENCLKIIYKYDN